MPWEKGTPSLRPERWREPGSIPGGIEKLSRPFRPQLFVIPPPRASASGLSPGLESPGPLGRPDDPSLTYQTSSQSAEDPHPSDAKPGTNFRDVVLAPLEIANLAQIACISLLHLVIIQPEAILADRDVEVCTT